MVNLSNLRATFISRACLVTEKNMFAVKACKLVKPYSSLDCAPANWADFKVFSTVTTSLSCEETQEKGKE